MKPPDRARRWAAIALVTYAALITVIGIVPRPIDWGLTPWIRGLLATLHRHGLRGWIDYDAFELASHVMLFVPFGILAVVALGRRLAWLAVLAGLGMSALVEFGPALLGSEHPPSGLDLFLNAIGAVIGTAIGYRVLAPRAPAGVTTAP